MTKYIASCSFGKDSLAMLIKIFAKYIFYDLQHGYEGDIFPDRNDG